MQPSGFWHIHAKTPRGIVAPELLPYFKYKLRTSERQPEIEQREETGMKRQVSIEEIWDGRFYGPGDMVKAGCGECSGCSDCCKGMGKTIVLDPLQIHGLIDITFSS